MNRREQPRMPERIVIESNDDIQDNDDMIEIERNETDGGEGQDINETEEYNL